MASKQEKAGESKKEPNIIIDIEKKFARFLEEVKVTNDYLKYIATLDTGSILIMATFLQHSNKSGAGSLVAISALCFILSLVGVIAAQGLLVRHISDTVDNANMLPNAAQKRLYRLSSNLAYIGFAFGISFLTVFIFYNF